VARKRVDLLENPHQRPHKDVAAAKLKMRRANMGGRAAMKRLWNILLLLPLLAACSALPTPVVVGKTNTFLGMSALVAAEPSRPLHVLIVHGIGTPAPYQFEDFIASLAGRFGLAQVPPPATVVETSGCHPATPAHEALLHPAPQVIAVEGVPPDAQARLYTYSFASRPDAPPALTVSYLLWSPLTETIKCGLATEDDQQPPRQAFANAAKDFIDDKLADVVLYGGIYREAVMRPSVQAALCVVTGGVASPDGKTCRAGDYRDPTVVITHSMGGYMLMDAIDDELRNQDCGTVHGGSPAQKILENTQFIYMMANQVALLDLTTLSHYPRPAGAPPPPPSASDKLEQRFTRCWTGAAVKVRAALPSSGTEEAPGQKPTRQIVAFSDPNDILSWPLKERNLGLPRPEWSTVELTNVYMSNGEFSIPLLFSDPVTAHTGYFLNPTVMDMLVCGMNKGAVQACIADAGR